MDLFLLIKTPACLHESDNATKITSSDKKNGKVMFENFPHYHSQNSLQSFIILLPDIQTYRESLLDISSVWVTNIECTINIFGQHYNNINDNV